MEKLQEALRLLQEAKTELENYNTVLRWSISIKPSAGLVVSADYPPKGYNVNP